MRTLEKILIRNLRSIRHQELALGALNVLIGGNGSGKSNLIDTFGFLNQIVNRRLQIYTGTAGGADKLLHFDRKHSKGFADHGDVRRGNARQRLRCSA